MMNLKRLGSGVRLLTAILALVSGSARAEILHFREGGKVTLPIARDGEHVVLDTPMGRLRFPESDFARIEPGESYAEDWKVRRALASTQGPGQRLAAALWALSHGLVADAETLIRESSSAFLDHAELNRFRRCLERLDREPSEPDLKPLLAALPAGMKVTAGPHVLLVHRDTEAAAEERMGFLETILKAYYLDFTALGFDLPAPSRKLVSVVFSNEAEYLAHLRREGASGFLNTRGYYHPTSTVVFAYDCRGDDLRVRSASAIADRREEIRRLSDRVAKLAPTARMKLGMAGQPARPMGRKDAETFIAGLRRQVDRQEMLLELTRREIDLGVAAHETIHQLVAITRLAPTNDRFPNWLHEGLAMQYESIRGGRWAGLSHPSGLRLGEFRKVSPPPRLEKALATTSLGQGYNRDGYATAWSLVYYLRQERTPAFVAILDTLRAPSLEAEPGASLLIDALKSATHTELADEEARWHQALRSLHASRPEPNNADHPD